MEVKYNTKQSNRFNSNHQLQGYKDTVPYGFKAPRI